MVKDTWRAPSLLTDCRPLISKIYSSASLHMTKPGAILRGYRLRTRDENRTAPRALMPGDSEPPGSEKELGRLFRHIRKINAQCPNPAHR